MNSQRGNTVIITLGAAIMIPRVEQWTGIKLTINDIADLFAAGALGWHAFSTVFEHYFPPKVPFTQPVIPAKE